MKKIKVTRKTTVTALPNSLTIFTNATLSKEDEFDAMKFIKNDFSTVETTGVNFSNCLFQNVNIDTSVLKKTGVVNSEFINSSISNANMDESYLSKVLFSTIRLTGIKLNFSIIKDVRFENCKLNYAQFQNTKFKDVVFSNCDLTEAFFNNSELINVKFENCDLAKVDFSAVKLKDLVLGNSKIEGMRLDPTVLKGCTVNLEQAIYIIRLMGMKFSMVEDYE